MTPLQALRIYGPCSSATLAAKLGRGVVGVRLSCRHLQRCGYAVREIGGWDVSEAGRAYLERRAAARKTARGTPGPHAVDTVRRPAP